MASPVWTELFRSNARMVVAEPRHEFRHKDVLWVCAGLAAVLFLLAVAAYTTRWPYASALLCFAATAVGMALAIAWPCPLSVHAAVASLIALYQEYHYRTRIDVWWWLEGVVLAAVLAVLAFEYAVLHYAVGIARAPETMEDVLSADGVREHFGPVATAVLLTGAALPFPGTGLFYLAHWQQGVAAALWALLAATEAHKTRIVEGGRLLTLPSVAAKCAPVLYLHPYYWSLVFVFVALNLRLLRARVARPQTAVV